MNAIEELVTENKLLETQNVMLDQSLDETKDQRNLLAIVAGIGWGLLTTVLMYFTFHGGN